MTSDNPLKLLILDDYTSSSTSLADWSPLTSRPNPRVELTVLNRPIPPSQLLTTLSQFDMLHAMRERTKLPRQLLEPLSKKGGGKLSFITTTGMHNRGIDLEACTELGIVVSGTDSVESRSASGTVEQTWALILALSRRLVEEHENLTTRPDGVWQTGVATGLRGKTLGLIGVGRLGKQVARVGKAFGMNVVGWSPNLTEERAKEAGVEVAGSLEDLLKGSDVVSLHIILSDKTRGMLGRKELELIKSTAFLINTSRGPLIDEEALIDVLKRRSIAGVGLDVFDVEPLPQEHPLRSLDNVVLSPHMGYVENPVYETWFKQTVENVEKFLEGNPVRLLQ